MQAAHESQANEDERMHLSIHPTVNHGMYEKNHSLDLEKTRKNGMKHPGSESQRPSGMPVGSVIHFLFIGGIGIHTVISENDRASGNAGKSSHSLLPEDPCGGNDKTRIFVILGTVVIAV
jgi:hypothetical protein